VDVRASQRLEGGEGGSVLQALGSAGEKAQSRTERRAERKEAYAKYLDSSAWKKIRRVVLRGDGNTCLACGGRAEVVHHISYPKNLGEEKLEWLYSL
jgi:5-methylcytosine-specific restriction endonuclease McrA